MGILKNQLVSRFGLQGSTPEKRAGAKNTSQLHSQERNPSIMKANHSELDLDGQKPKTGTYRDNAPEGSSF